ncbi:MAG: DUF5906 domain-containing protein [Oscillospiraceae bacterium]|nr:DUF5906 domain-containing protein [Oscillospiraceae bacterium]
MLTAFCGKDNTSAVQLDALAKDFILATVAGKTANIYPDLKKAKIQFSDFFKTLADGSRVTINPKHKTPYQHRFTTKFIFGTNQHCDFSADMAGVERRALILKFPHVYDKTAPDYNPSLDIDLAAPESLSALLNLAIKGYQSLLANKGFIETAESQRAHDEFVKSNDSIARWLYDCEVAEHEILNHSTISFASGVWKTSWPKRIAPNIFTFTKSKRATSGKHSAVMKFNPCGKMPTATPMFRLC